jgi:UDP-N-acetyl-D-glucosamine dehydrogenase
MASQKTAEPMDSALAALRARLESKSAQVGIIGLGYVGLPLGLLFARKGLHTTGFDIDPRKVEMLGRGESYIRHLESAAITEQVRGKRFEATADFARLQAMDAVVICVPTPLHAHREPDLTYIRSTAESIRPNLRHGQLIVLESTTYPGTTEEVVLPILEQSGLRCPVVPDAAGLGSLEKSGDSPMDFFLAFSPEREDPGNKQFETQQIPKIVGGVNGPSALAAQALYQQAFDRTILVSSSRVAEMSKLLENIYRCVNIAMVNELKLLCLRMGIDIWEVIEAAKTKPFGFTAFYPGPGLGGHCIPIDPFYLTWKAREYEFPTRFIELAGEINASMPEHVVASVSLALDQRGQCLKGSKILVLGIAYKKDVDDVRESPALRIMELLLDRGARVDYHDPYIPRTHKMRSYDFQMVSIELTPQALGQYSAVLIATDHSNINYADVVRHARLVVDTRNATRDVTGHRDKIVRC